MVCGEEMNSRERMLAAFEYNKPDKIPVLYKPCAAGLYVHGQKSVECLIRSIHKYR